MIRNLESVAACAFSRASERRSGHWIACDAIVVAV